ncbi:MAG: hypothetical protein RL321_986 [Pseudomonadota bacterium]|jgi:hypothetical protein
MRDLIRRGLLSLLATSVLLTLSPSGLAQSTSTASTYNVEVIVFRNNGPREAGIDGTPPLRGAEESDTPAAAAQIGRFISATPAARLTLTGVRQKMAAGGYRILAHAGWTQTASSWGSRTGIPLETLGVAVPGLSGHFLLERGSLLHFGMNLRYEPDESTIHELSELRRVRFEERHYYDHPGIGVLAVVTSGAARP